MAEQKEKKKEEPQIKKDSYMEELLKRIIPCIWEDDEDTELNEGRN